MCPTLLTGEQACSLGSVLKSEVTGINSQMQEFKDEVRRDLTEIKELIREGQDRQREDMKSQFDRGTGKFDNLTKRVVEVERSLAVEMAKIRAIKTFMVMVLSSMALLVGILADFSAVVRFIQ